MYDLLERAVRSLAEKEIEVGMKTQADYLTEYNRLWKWRDLWVQAAERLEGKRKHRAFCRAQKKNWEMLLLTEKYEKAR